MSLPVRQFIWNIVPLTFFKPSAIPSFLLVDVNPFKEKQSLTF